MALDRVKTGDKGHSNKEPIYTVQSRTEDGQPLVSTFTSKELKFFDPKKKEYVNFSGKLTMSTKMDLNLRLKFLAKVALAVGYFLFGKNIEEYTDCDALRMIIIANNLQELFEEHPDKFKGLKFYDSFHKIKDSDKTMIDMYKLYCQYIKKSNILWTYSKESIIVYVSLLGKFVDLINFKAKVDEIPYKYNDNYWLGHIMICDKNKLIRKSWRDAILEIAEVYNFLSKEVIEDAKNFRG